MKTCGECKENKNNINFRLCKYKNGKTYYYSICKECSRLKALKYAELHREERREYQKKYNLDNPSYIKNWKVNNRDKINKKERQKRKNNICFKIKKNFSRAINRAVYKNKNSTFKYLPYAVQELKQHLENQFDKNMTWENYGSYWHIDHIIPHSDFNYTSMDDEGFKKCWALSNLRPLNAKQNMLDGATRIRHKK